MTCWAVVPAAGIGKRMGSELPKQYLVLAGKTVLEHTIQGLQQHPRIEGVIVALHPDDQYWQKLQWRSKKPLLTVSGGEQRADSVLNALDALKQQLDPDTWVMVHDAARPCVRAEAISRLFDRVLESNAVGGLLGTPVRDTMKRSDKQARILATVDRQYLWHAHTPQMFKLGGLQQALRAALANGSAITDEASAMELAGQSPLMVDGGADNIKITQPDDLRLAEFFLEQERLNPE